MVFSHPDMFNFAIPWTVASQAPLIHGIFQARILEWVAISYYRGFSGPRGWTRVSCVSCISRQILYHCAMPLSIHSDKQFVEITLWLTLSQVDFNDQYLMVFTPLYTVFPLRVSRVWFYPIKYSTSGEKSQANES